MILWNRLRCLLGKASQALIARRADDGCDDSLTDRDRLRALGLPAWNEGEWTQEGMVNCLSGRLVVADPMEFPNPEPSMGVVIEEVPVGAHRFELQRFNVKRGYGRRVLRARVLWGDLQSPELEYIGAAGVDLGALSIADAGQTAELTHDQVEDAGFEPNGLIIGDIDYDCIDPLDGANCFLHVFESGFGDGSYPVLRIKCAGRSCGNLIDMSGLLDADELETSGT
jgi:hypothetical protein